MKKKKVKTNWFKWHIFCNYCHSSKSLHNNFKSFQISCAAIILLKNCIFKWPNYAWHFRIVQRTQVCLMYKTTICKTRQYNNYKPEKCKTRLDVDKTLCTYNSCTTLRPIIYYLHSKCFQTMMVIYDNNTTFFFTTRVY